MLSSKLIFIIDLLFIFFLKMTEVTKETEVNNLLRELKESLWSCIEAYGESEDLKKIEEEWTGLDSNEKIGELEKAYKKATKNENKEYVFSNGQKKVVLNELVKQYTESLLNVNMIDIDSRSRDNMVEMDYHLKYLDEIMKYMNNEYDINELNEVEFDEFCSELMIMRIPFRMDVMSRLFTGSNEYGDMWKKRSVVVNGHEYNTIFDYLKLKLNHLRFNKELNRIEYQIDSQYESIVQSLSKFIEDDNSDCCKLIEKLDRRTVNKFINENIIDMNRDVIQSFFYPIYSPFLKESIINTYQYDSYLREWVGDYKWKLLYRSSEHNYTSKSFHKYCNDQGPTLAIIKSSEGWIFGGYATKSWRGSGMCYYEHLIVNRRKQR